MTGVQTCALPISEQHWLHLGPVLIRLLDLNFDGQAERVRHIVESKLAALAGYWGSTAFSDSDYDKFGEVIGRLYCAGKWEATWLLDKSLIQSENLQNSKLPGIARHAVAWALDHLIQLHLESADPRQALC